MTESLPPVIVELPFDPEYLTDAGQYMAGYHWGKKIRSPDEFTIPGRPYGDWVELYPRFVQGVRDGYGDGMRKNEKEMATNQEQARKTAKAKALRAKRDKARLEKYWKDDRGGYMKMDMNGNCYPCGFDKSDNW